MVCLCVIYIQSSACPLQNSLNISQHFTEATWFAINGEVPVNDSATFICDDNYVFDEHELDANYTVICSSHQQWAENLSCIASSLYIW